MNFARVKKRKDYKNGKDVIITNRNTAIFLLFAFLSIVKKGNEGGKRIRLNRKEKKEKKEWVKNWNNREWHRFNCGISFIRFSDQYDPPHALILLNSHQIIFIHSDSSDSKYRKSQRSNLSSNLITPSKMHQQNNHFSYIQSKKPNS